jgi:hypothetical protein
MNSKGDFLIPIEVHNTPGIFRNSPNVGDQIFIQEDPKKFKVEITMDEYNEYTHLKRLFDEMNSFGLKDWDGYQKSLALVAKSFLNGSHHG